MKEDGGDPDDWDGVATVAAFRCEPIMPLL